MSQREIVRTPPTPCCRPDFFLRSLRSLWLMPSGYPTYSTAEIAKIAKRIEQDSSGDCQDAANSLLPYRLFSAFFAFFVVDPVFTGKECPERGRFKQANPPEAIQASAATACSAGNGRRVR
jgi:hypothetical protein